MDLRRLSGIRARRRATGRCRPSWDTGALRFPPFGAPHSNDGGGNAPLAPFTSSAYWEHLRRLAIHLGRQAEDELVDKNRVAGAADKAKGSIKEAAGKVTGDSKLKAEGKADKASGAVKSAIGGAADALKGKA
jgi:uncharacterized protein YjbJ (UPF0337 family)